MNQLFDIARELAATTGLGWTTGNFVVYLIDTDNYTFNAADEYLSAVPSSALVAGPIALTGNTAVGGACDANDPVFPAVTGPEVGALLLVKDTGSDATSPLIAWIDTATNLPIMPAGVDITFTIDAGPNKLFRV